MAQSFEQCESRTVGENTAKVKRAGASLGNLTPLTMPPPQPSSRRVASARSWMNTLKKGRRPSRCTECRKARRSNGSRFFGKRTRIIRLTRATRSPNLQISYGTAAISSSESDGFSASRATIHLSRQHHTCGCDRRRAWAISSHTCGRSRPRVTHHQALAGSPRSAPSARARRQMGGHRSPLGHRATRRARGTLRRTP